MKKKISAQAMKDIIYSAAHFAGREKDIKWEGMGYWDITGRKPCAIIRFEQPYGDPPDFMEATFFFRPKEPGGNELEAACYLRGFMNDSGAYWRERAYESTMRDIWQIVQHMRKYYEDEAWENEDD